MTPIKRPLAAAGAAALLALSLSACGGSAPTDASETDFCKVALKGGPDLANVDDDDYDAQEDAIRGYADDLEEVGTPEDIPDAAREGFEAIIKAYNEVDAGDLKDAAENEDSDVEKEFKEKYEDDEENVAAYFTYIGETCVDVGGDTPDSSIDPSDQPSIDPSDLPSVPEELQSQLDELDLDELEKLTEVPESE